MKKVLLLTDISNGETEDIITGEFLRRYFDVQISYLIGIEDIEEDFDLIIIRNTWPSNEEKHEEYHLLKNEFFQRAREKKLNIYNSLDASVDRTGKKYLIDLYNNGYPVIPTVSNISDLPLLGEILEFVIKPEFGFSSEGFEILNKNEIIKSNLEGYIIQPKIDYKHEISFYFIDQNLLYCLIFEPSKIPEWPSPIVYTPSEKDIEFAMKFIDWGNLTVGIQRIDALRLLDDTLLLLEIEDDSPYFSITDIPKTLQKIFLGQFRKSINKQLCIGKNN